MRDDACGMKVGTDALVLGSWAGALSSQEQASPLRILDVGTGSGILALMLAQRFPLAVVDALELEPEAAAQAAENAAKSPFSERIRIHARAAQGWSEPADLVVCNPPFFHGHPKSLDRKRNLARHDDTLPLRSLFAVVRACLSEGGEFALVFPEDRSSQLCDEAASHGLCLQAQIGLRATPQHDVIRSLWSWTNRPNDQVSRQLWDLESPQGGGAWSDEMAARLRPFVKSLP
ncbi:MAG: tRNA1(Val) (adenine(37)-N6)-methyltransferase [Flavobacteriales bacterium]